MGNLSRFYTSFFCCQFRFFGSQRKWKIVNCDIIYTVHCRFRIYLLHIKGYVT